VCQTDVVIGEFAGHQCDAIDGLLRKILKRLPDQVGFFRDGGK
jgi:hypothetical protein